MCLELPWLQLASMHLQPTWILQSLRSHNVPFHLLIGFAKDTVPQFAAAHNIAAVVTDFAPLRVPLQWVGDVGAALDSMCWAQQ